MIFSKYIQCVVATVIMLNISIVPKNTFKTHFTQSFPSASGHHSSTFHIYSLLLKTFYVNKSLKSFVYGFFHLVLLRCVSVVTCINNSFLLIAQKHSMVFHTTVCLSIHQLMDFWVVSSFWRFWPLIERFWPLIWPF